MDEIDVEMGSDLCRPPLRVGLLVNSFYQPQWIQKVIADIKQSKLAETVLVISNDLEVQLPNKQSLSQKLYRVLFSGGQKFFLFNCYSLADSRIFRCQPNAYQGTSVENLLQGCPVVKVRPKTKGYTQRLALRDIERIREYDLDIILRFGFRILRGEILNVARYGLWSYHHGDNLVNRGMPAGFWEVMENNPVTGTILQILSENLDGGKVIYRSYFPTEHSVSTFRNQNSIAWRSSPFVIRKIRDLYYKGPSSLQDPLGDEYRPYSKMLYVRPTNRRMLPLLARSSARYLRKKLKSKLKPPEVCEQWFVAFKTGRKEAPMLDSFHNFSEIIPPNDRFWADPFPLKMKGKYYIFVEELLYKTQKGHIAVIEMDSYGKHTMPVKVLEQDYHLAYPHVFQWNGDVFMVPESFENGTIEVYRSCRFPLEWELIDCFMTGVKAVDTTIAQIEDQWWLFTCIKAEGPVGSFHELHIFHADQPLGPWRPNKFNPVKLDVRGARGAGKIFSYAGNFYRPAQDCSVKYGYGITINRIDQITTDDYRESLVGEIKPQWRKDLLGTHTINHLPGLTVIDGARQRKR